MELSASRANASARGAEGMCGMAPASATPTTAVCKRTSEMSTECRCYQVRRLSLIICANHQHVGGEFRIKRWTYEGKSGRNYPGCVSRSSTRGMKENLWAVAQGFVSDLEAGHGRRKAGGAGALRDNWKRSRGATRPRLPWRRRQKRRSYRTPCNRPISKVSTTHS